MEKRLTDCLAAHKRELTTIKTKYESDIAERTLQAKQQQEDDVDKSQQRLAQLQQR
jgi:hypothetical protein